MLQPAIESETLPVLVPVDLSQTSNKALLLAAQLAAYSSQPLVVLHVAHDDARRPNIYQRRNKIEQMLPIEEIASRMLQAFMDKLCEQNPESAVLVNAELIVVTGLPATRIPEIAHQTGAGLIVMGGNGRTSLSKLIAGSVSEKVIRNSPVPVSIVHSHEMVLEQGEQPLSISA